MPIYAVAETVPERKRRYITPGKRYALVPNEWGCDERVLGSRGFAWRDDEGDVNYSTWSRCRHLGGGNWTRIDEPDEPPTPDPRDALMAELARALHGILTALDEERAHFSDEYNSAVAALAKYEGSNK